MKNKKFSVNETIEELRTTMIRKMNPATAFIEEQLEYVNDPKAIIEEIELYRIASIWWKKEGLPTTAKANFTKAMRQFFPEAKQTMARIGGKPKHVWQFVQTVTSVTTSLLTYNSGENNSLANNHLVTPVTPNSQNNRSAQEQMKTTLSVFVELEKEIGMVDRATLVNELNQKHNFPISLTERLIWKLLREGTIFECKEGFYKKT